MRKQDEGLFELLAVSHFNNQHSLFNILQSISGGHIFIHANNVIGFVFVFLEQFIDVFLHNSGHREQFDSRSGLPQVPYNAIVVIGMVAPVIMNEKFPRGKIFQNNSRKVRKPFGRKYY